MAYASKITVDTTTYDIKGKSVENAGIPTSSFPSGLKFCYTDMEPETKYDGYMYMYKYSWQGAGLYSSGTLSMSWASLIANNYISVSGTTVYSTASTSSKMIGELYGDSSILSISAYAFINCTSLASASFPNCSYIGGGAFIGCTSLTSVSFPACSYINYGAFSSCTSLTSVSFPACSYISYGAFSSCTSLTSVSFPACSYVGWYAFGSTPFQNNQISASGYAEYSNSINKFLLAVSSASGFTSFTGNHTFICDSAFQSWTSLTSVSFPVCSYIGGNVFRGCISLTSVSFPVCSYIGGNAFQSCTSLTSVSFPVCSYIGGGAFRYCSALTSTSFSICDIIKDKAFQSCTSLTSVSFPVCSYIGGDVFRGCISLTSIYLMSTSVCTLYNSNAFSSTGITSSTGSIIVPTSLVTAYQSAANWSYFSNRIFGA